MSADDFDAWASKLAGLAGSLVSMRYLTGSWPQKISAVVSGTITALYAAPWVAEKLSMPAELTGFLVGLFGVAIVQRAWEAIQTAPLGAVWQALIDRIRGNGANRGNGP